MTSQPMRPPLVFYRTGPMPCPYLPGRIERNLFTELRGNAAQPLHDSLAQAGFRRSHHIVYRPACPGCSACVPVRIATRDFAPGRSLRRVWRRNADIVARVRAPEATAEQYALFTRYQGGRHAGGEMATMTVTDYRAMVEDTTVDTILVEFRDAGDVLLGGCLVDRLGDGLSAVYSYFDPEAADRSLGTYIVMWLIEHARALSLAHVYLGYWVRDCAKMVYKTRFAPLEALGPDGWQPLSADHGEMPISRT
ncbi:MAG: arginyltransferase [Alphaproteobacteria bacterium]